MVDLSRRMSILKVVANSFEKGEWSRAMISAAHLRLPPLEGDAAVECLRKVESLVKYNFNPNEPRDWHGRWTYVPGWGHGPTASAATPQLASYNSPGNTISEGSIDSASHETQPTSGTQGDDHSKKILLDANGKPVLGFDEKPIHMRPDYPPQFFINKGLEDAKKISEIMPKRGLDGVYDFVYAELSNFAQGHIWDMQRPDGRYVDSLRDYATVAIGLYCAALGMPQIMSLAIQTYYAFKHSKFFSNEEMDPILRYLPKRNVFNTNLGYKLYNIYSIKNK